MSQLDLTLNTRNVEGLTHGTWKQRWELQFDPIPGPTLFQTFKNAYELFRGRELLGTIVEVSDTEPLRVDWMTYGQTWEKAREVASGLFSLMGNSLSEFFSLYSINRPEWVVCDLVTMMLGWTSVPVPASLDIKDVEYILQHAEVTCMVTSRSLLPRIRAIIDRLPKLRLLVVMDSLSSSEYLEVVSDFGSSRDMQARPTHADENSPSGYASSAGGPSSKSTPEMAPLLIVDFEDVVKIGKAHLMEKPNLPANESETIATIVYTSGSTGRPKGAVNSYARWNNFISFLYNMPLPLVRLSFMPLAHNTERQQSHLTVCYGGKMCFSRGDMSKIFEEFALVNPTSLSAAPRFYDSIYSQYQATLAQFRKDYPEVMPSQAEQYCLAQYRGILGNAMKVLVVGGAAVSAFTKEFLTKCFEIAVFDGYGTTEAGGITADGKLYPGTEVKIVDCPELGYTSQDLPYPRGEVWAKTTAMVSGYYKDPETTNEYFKDGWFITGDIVEVRNGDQYFIVDRRKNLFKLSQGVFVAPSAIENKLIVSDFVHQIYVYGDHTRSSLVAVVVPNLENLAKWCAEHGHINIPQWSSEHKIPASSDPAVQWESLTTAQQVSTILASSVSEEFSKYLCSLPVSNAKVHREIVNTAQQIDLPPYHTPAAITLEYEKWTVENRLVTPSDKPQRAALEKKYGEDIRRMYQEVLDAQHETEIVSDQVKDVVDGMMSENGSHGNSKDGDAETSAPSLATDSLTVLKLIHTLNRKFGTNLSFMDVMRETGGRLTPELIAKVIQRRSAAKSERNVLLDPWSLHDPRILSDLDITVPVDDALVVDFYAHLDTHQHPKHVLITGSTGFLGFHLVSELLQQFPPETIFTLLVRAEDDNQAKARVLKDTASRQKRTFTEAEGARINFVVGDLAKPLLGLSSESFSKLAEETDSIYHVGAVVNWLWGYETMRDTNVLGTVELLKLATTHHLKYFFFISTASTSNGIALVPAEPSSPLLVDWKGIGPLEETSLLRRDEAVNRSAYVLSKWVSETIVRRSIQLGLPGCVLRPSMITGHSKTGACHPTDFCPRLLIGLCQSGLAFKSDLPLEWMPVDYCAKAIIGLSSHFVSSILPVLAEAQAFGVVPSFNIQNFAMATYSQISSYLQEARVKLDTVEYLEWRKAITDNPQSPLWPLLPFFGEDACHMYAHLLPAPQTITILNELGIHCPPADKDLFHTYLRYLSEERLIEVLK